VSSRVSRRAMLRTGLTAAAGVSGLAAAAEIAKRYGLIPPDSGGLYGIGETLTYGSQRVLMATRSMAREFSRNEISKVAPVNGDPPESDDYQQLLAREFSAWRLVVDGLVTKPASFSLTDLRRLPSRTQITHQACEEGWSFIAEWAGVPLSALLDVVWARPEARWVVFYPFDEFWDSIDIAEARHPQTLLAYSMNGGDLTTGHGAPLRLRVPRQLGYKSIKYLSRITLVDALDGVENGKGSFSPDIGYSWYAGI
jgi:DMSO/TMAO reductase YedYZ molybdopterin-dependent catalytic subunit